MASVTGYVSGRLTAPAGVWREGDEWDVEVAVPAPCYLIEAGGERILLDTGLHPEGGAGRYGPVADAMTWDLPPAPPPVEPTLIVLTHLHFDHAGGLTCFPDVPVSMQRAEWEAAHDPALLMYAPVDFEGVEPQLVDGEHDLLGDGSVVLRPTPGHTPGHQSVIVTLDDGRQVLLAGDACYFPENLDTGATPPYGWDRARELESLRWVRRQRDAGLVVVFGHDPSAGTFVG